MGRSVVTLVGALVALAGWSPATSVAAGEGCPPPALLPGESTGAAPPPARIPAPPARVLVCVGSWPITGATFDHWAIVARKSMPADARHSGRHETAKARREQVRLITIEVMAFLISGDWVLEEAQQLGVDGSASKVRRSFDHIRREQFPKHGEFRKFLKSTGQTVGDLLFRVRLHLDSAAIQKRVVEGKGGEGAVKSFRAKWRPQTYCVSTFAVPDCGVVRASL